MSDANEKIEGHPTASLDVGQLAAAFGLASAVVLFLAAITSWSFARGLISSTGFPAQVATFRSSIDCFPSMAFDYVGAFLAALAGGFVPTYDPTKRVVRLRICIVVMLLVFPLDFLGQIWVTHSIYYRWPLLLALLITPLFIGYAYRSFAAGERTRYIIVGAMCFLALQTYTEGLYQYGQDIGVAISAHMVPEHPGSERGLAAVKSSDFPLVTLRTKEKILMVTEGSKDGDLFTYQIPATLGFLRLILQDESNYYLIENHLGDVRAIAVRKEIVSEILFSK